MSIPVLVNASESIDLLRAGQKPAPDVQRVDSAANLEEGHLRVLGARLKDIQRSLGRSQGNLTPFDGEAAPVLHELLRLDCRSATLPGFWAYLSVVSFPDIVQWRFGGREKQVPENRYLGHGWKNTFKRLWYRAELAYDPTLDDPYQYARLGGEDFWVGLIERRFCECRNLTRQLLRFWFDSESDSARTMTDHRRFFIAVRLLRPFKMYEHLDAKEAFELSNMLCGLQSRIGYTLTPDCDREKRTVYRSLRHGTMPIHISKNLRAKLPGKERGDIEQLLIDKAGDVCHLCDGPINQASDRLVADHDVPESEGGATEFANLNLVHTECNSFKRDHPTVSVRPFLRFARFLRESNGPANYADCIEPLSIDPMASHIKEVSGGMEFQFPDGSVCVTPLHTVTTRQGDFTYSFVDVPRTAIFNDDSCQPRSINQRHLWAIYSDLAWNPLHEPPGLRVQPDRDDSKMTRLLMFDGQHKTLASWLLDYDTVSCKVYLNITEEQTVRLVNSVQAKIKKLPLSPFELSAKMAVEWQDRIGRYEDQVGTDAASEAGFLSWVGKDERTRARSAFKDALFQNIIDRDDLTYLPHVARPGARKSALQVTEAAFRNKVLAGLLHVRALDESFEQSQRLRDREADTITRVLNSLAGLVYDPDQNDGKLSEQQKTRAKRLTYQSALQYVASLVKAAVGHILFADEDREFLDKSPNKKQWKQIEEALQRIVEHPVWTKDFGDSKKMEAVELALTKNQNATKAFKDVELRHGYVLGADKLDKNSLN